MSRANGNESKSFGDPDSSSSAAFQSARKRASQQSGRKRPRRRILEFIALGLAVISILVSWYFGKRAEREKALTVRYVAVRPLLTDPRKSEKLVVTYEDQVVEQPWFLTARLENTGNTPIIEDDIDTLLLLQFPAGRVLGVDIGATNPPGIPAAAIQQASEVEIEPTLLNPGDYISFDVLLDGDPKLPTALVRVVGVSRPIVLHPSDETSTFYATWFQLPRPVEYIALTITSLGIVFLLIVLVFLVVEQWAPSDYSATSVEDFFSTVDDVLDEMGIDIYPDTFAVPASVIATALGRDNPVQLAWIDNPAGLESMITKQVPGALLDAYKISPQEATKLIVQEMRAQLPATLRERIVSEAPWGFSSAVEESMSELRFEENTVDEFFKKVRRQLGPLKDSLPESSGSLDSNSWEDWVGSLVIFIIIVSATLVVGGTWRSLLAQ